MLGVAGQEQRVEGVEVGRAQLLKPSSPNGPTAHVQADVPTVGLEGGRFDGVLDRGLPCLGQKRGDRLAFWLDVGAVIDRREDPRQFALRIASCRETASSSLPPLASGLSDISAGPRSSSGVGRLLSS